MRTYPLFVIFLLCLAILIVDIAAFYWLQSITKLITSQFLQNSIHIAFWTFTIGLIAAILILKTRMKYIPIGRRQLLTSYIYGLAVSSFIPKLIFVVIISILYYTNFVFSETQSLVVVPIVGLLSGFLPFLAIVYGVFITLYRFKVYKIELQSEVLPASFNGLRLVQISDLHLGSFNSRYHILDRAIKTINQLKPDLIFFTGDLVNNYAWELKGWSLVFQRLSSHMGKFAILGNHDYGDYSKWKSNKAKQDNLESIKYFFTKIGFDLLLNESRIIKRGEDEIAIIGVENWGKPPFKQYGDLNQAMKDVVDVPFKILLSHDPSHWSEEVVNDTDIALSLSGHTHGMQVGIRIKTKEWSPIKYKYKHWAGLYEINKQYLHVNRGLGWMGFPGRLGMRPEITFIELQATED